MQDFTESSAFCLTTITYHLPQGTNSSLAICEDVRGKHQQENEQQSIQEQTRPMETSVKAKDQKVTDTNVMGVKLQQASNGFGGKICILKIIHFYCVHNQ